MYELPFFSSEGTQLLQGESFRDVLFSEIELAQSRLWGCYFIVSVTVYSDPHQQIRDLCDGLIRAKQRGVDVRMIVEPTMLDEESFGINLVAAKYLLQQGVPVRLYADLYKPLTHSKTLVIDGKTQLVGSGNLTHGGLEINDELALRIVSVDLAHWLAERHLRNWSNAKELPSL